MMLSPQTRRAYQFFIFMTISLVLFGMAHFVFLPTVFDVTVDTLSLERESIVNESIDIRSQGETFFGIFLIVFFSFPLYIVPIIALYIMADTVILPHHAVIQRYAHVIMQVSLIAGVLTASLPLYSFLYSETTLERQAYLRWQMLFYTLHYLMNFALMVLMGGYTFRLGTFPSWVSGPLLLGGVVGIFLSVLALEPSQSPILRTLIVPITGAIAGIVFSAYMLLELLADRKIRQDITETIDLPKPS